MSSTYTVKVNDAFGFDIAEDEISKKDIIKTSDTVFHILQNNTSYYAEVKESDFNSKQYTISINNNNYLVDISNGLDLRIKEMGFSIGSSKHVNEVKAPMPGLLLDVHVKIDQEVKEDDPLLILEAMKMENIILSPRNGVIKSISASKGDAVDKGQILIEFA